MSLIIEPRPALSFEFIWIYGHDLLLNGMRDLVIRVDRPPKLDSGTTWAFFSLADACPGQEKVVEEGDFCSRMGQ